MVRRSFVGFLVFSHITLLTSPAICGQAIILTDQELDEVHAGGLNFNFDNFLGNVGQVAGNLGKDPLGNQNSAAGGKAPVVTQPNSNVQILDYAKQKTNVGPSLPQPNQNANISEKNGALPLNPADIQDIVGKLAANPNVDAQPLETLASLQNALTPASPNNGNGNASLPTGQAPKVNPSLPAQLSTSSSPAEQVALLNHSAPISDLKEFAQPAASPQPAVNPAPVAAGPASQPLTSPPQVPNQAPAAVTAVPAVVTTPPATNSAPGNTTTPTAAPVQLAQNTQQQAGTSNASQPSANLNTLPANNPAAQNTLNATDKVLGGLSKNVPSPVTLDVTSGGNGQFDIALNKSDPTAGLPDVPKPDTGNLPGTPNDVFESFSFKGTAGSVNVVNVGDRSQQNLSALVNVNAAGSVVPVQVNLTVVINSNITGLNANNTLDLRNYTTFQLR